MTCTHCHENTPNHAITYREGLPVCDTCHRRASWSRIALCVALVCGLLRIALRLAS